MMKQIPYTAAKLTGYEMLKRPIERAYDRHLVHLDQGQKLFLASLTAGIFAGVTAAVISQPADVLLSKVCGGSNALAECVIIDGVSGLVQAMKDIGFKNSFAGLAPRSVMVGALTAGQMVIYEQAKQAIQQQ